jgi:hypothetical protein
VADGGYYHARCGRWNKEGHPSRLGFEKCGAVDVDKAVVTVCGCFLFFFVVYDVV